MRQTAVPNQAWLSVTPYYTHQTVAHDKSIDELIAVLEKVLKELADRPQDG